MIKVTFPRLVVLPIPTFSSLFNKVEGGTLYWGAFVYHIFVFTKVTKSAFLFYRKSKDIAGFFLRFIFGGVGGLGGRTGRGRWKERLKESPC